jgi:hypothetical protein
MKPGDAVFCRLPEGTSGDYCGRGRSGGLTAALSAQADASAALSNLNRYAIYTPPGAFVASTDSVVLIWALAAKRERVTEVLRESDFGLRVLVGQRRRKTQSS